MEFTHTKAELNRMLTEKICGDYAVLISHKRNETFLSSEGVDRDTYFDNASTGKILITAPLILRAVGEGKVSLDTALGECFKNVPEEKKKITVKQVLTHTSGIVRFELEAKAGDMDREELASYILSNPLAYEPDKDYRYSCNGYILLGLLAEKLYGESFDVLYEKYIKAPLGLTRSRFNIAGDEPNAVVCYSRKEMGPYRADDSNVRMLKGIAGNGASFWTAEDMNRYVKAVLAKDPCLYAPELYDLAEVNYTPYFEEGRGLGYLVVNEKYRQTGKLFPVGSFGHCGHTGQSIFISRPLDLYVILLTNTTRYSNIRSGFRGYDYGDTMRMRENVHNAIYEDFREQGILG